MADVAEAGARMPHRWIDEEQCTGVLYVTGSRFVFVVAAGADERRVVRKAVDRVLGIPVR